MLTTKPSLSKVLLGSILLILAAPFARAQDDGEALTRQAMCYACHQMDKPSIGPPWQAIAARHAARKELMTDVLAGKIVRGGGGSWGWVPMVPNQRVSESQARIMAQWVLAQTPN